jgi:cell division protein FtsL
MPDFIVSKPIIAQIKQLQIDQGKLQQDFGNLYVQEITLKERKEQAENIHKHLKNKEVELAELLESTYGKGQLDLENGKYNTIE